MVPRSERQKCWLNGAEACVPDASGAPFFTDLSDGRTFGYGFPDVRADVKMVQT